MAMRAVAALLVIGFGVQDLAAAAGGALPQLGGLPSVRIPDYGLPESIAVVEEAYQAVRSKAGQAAFGTDSRRVILIRDAHTNPSGQINLAKTLDTLSRRLEMPVVFTEGAAKDVSLSFLRSYGSAAERAGIGMEFVRKGELKGSEYQELAGDKDFAIVGVEEDRLYDRSVQIYRRVAASRAEASNYLSRIQITTQYLKSKLLNPELRAFEDEREAFLSGRLSWMKYLEVLTAKALAHGVTLTDFSRLEALKKIRTLEERMDFEAVQREIDRLSATLPPDDPLAGHGRDLNQAASDAPHFFEQASLGLTLKAGLKNSRGYPHLRSYLRYLDAARRLRPRELPAQERALTAALLDRLCVTADEKQLIRITDALNALKNLSEMRLTPEDRAAYRLDPASFDPSRITAFLNRKLMELGTAPERALFLDPAAAASLADAMRFYALADARDRVFVRRLVQRMDTRGLKTGLLITGGYHTDHLKRLLREQNISYVVLAPQVYEETDHNRYEKLLLEPRPQATQARSALIPRYAAATETVYQVAARLGVARPEVDAALGAGARLASLNLANGDEFNRLDNEERTRRLDFWLKRFKIETQLLPITGGVASEDFPDPWKPAVGVMGSARIYPRPDKYPHRKHLDRFDPRDLGIIYPPDTKWKSGSSRWFDDGVKIGQMLARWGFAIGTGAGPSIMEAAHFGAYLANPNSERQGVRIMLPFEQTTSAYLSKGRLVNYELFLLRKPALLQNKLGAIIFPGGFGSFDEASESLRRNRKVIFAGADFWGPILDVLRESMRLARLEGYMKARGVWPKATDDLEEAARYVTSDGSVAGPRIRDKWEAAFLYDEIDRTLSQLYRLPRAVTFIGRPMRPEDLYKVEQISAGLTAAGIPVRAGTRGLLFGAMQEAVPAASQELLQLVAYMNGSLSGTPEERSLGKERFVEVHDESVQQFLVANNSYAHVVFPGAWGTMNKLFDLMQILQIERTKPDFASKPGKPVILVGKAYWQPIIDEMRRQMLEKPDWVPMISPRDLDIVTVVDSAEEAVALLTQSVSAYRENTLNRAAARLAQAQDASSGTHSQHPDLQRLFARDSVVNIGRTAASEIDIIVSRLMGRYMKSRDVSEKEAIVYLIPQLHELARSLHDDKPDFKSMNAAAALWIADATRVVPPATHAICDNPYVLQYLHPEDSGLLYRILGAVRFEGKSPQYLADLLEKKSYKPSEVLAVLLYLAYHMDLYYVAQDRIAERSAQDRDFARFQQDMKRLVEAPDPFLESEAMAFVIKRLRETDREYDARAHRSQGQETHRALWDALTAHAASVAAARADESRVEAGSEAADSGKAAESVSWMSRIKALAMIAGLLGLVWWSSEAMVRREIRKEILTSPMFLELVEKVSEHEVREVSAATDRPAEAKPDTAKSMARLVNGVLAGIIHDTYGYHLTDDNPKILRAKAAMDEAAALFRDTAHHPTLKKDFVAAVEEGVQEEFLKNTLYPLLSDKKDALPTEEELSRYIESVRGDLDVLEAVFEAWLNGNGARLAEFYPKWVIATLDASRSELKDMLDLGVQANVKADKAGMKTRLDLEPIRSSLDVMDRQIAAGHVSLEAVDELSRLLKLFASQLEGSFLQDYLGRFTAKYRALLGSDKAGVKKNQIWIQSGSAGLRGLVAGLRTEMGRVHRDRRAIVLSTRRIESAYQNFAVKMTALAIFKNAELEDEDRSQFLSRLRRESLPKIAKAILRQKHAPDRAEIRRMLSERIRPAAAKKVPSDGGHYVADGRVLARVVEHASWTLYPELTEPLISAEADSRRLATLKAQASMGLNQGADAWNDWVEEVLEIWERCSLRQDALSVESSQSALNGLMEHYAAVPKEVPALETMRWRIERQFLKRNSVGAWDPMLRLFGDWADSPRELGLIRDAYRTAVFSGAAMDVSLELKGRAQLVAVYFQVLNRVFPAGSSESFAGVMGQIQALRQVVQEDAKLPPHQREALADYVLAAERYIRNHWAHWSSLAGGQMTYVHALLWCRPYAAFETEFFATGAAREKRMTPEETIVNANMRTMAKHILKYGFGVAVPAGARLASQQSSLDFANKRRRQGRYEQAEVLYQEARRNLTDHSDPNAALETLWNYYQCLIEHEEFVDKNPSSAKAGSPKRMVEARALLDEVTGWIEKHQLNEPSDAADWIERLEQLEKRIPAEAEATPIDDILAGAPDPAAVSIPAIQPNLMAEPAPAPAEAAEAALVAVPFKVLEASRKQILSVLEKAGIQKGRRMMIAAGIEELVTEPDSDSLKSREDFTVFLKRRLLGGNEALAQRIAAGFAFDTELSETKPESKPKTRLDEVNDEMSVILRDYSVNAWKLIDHAVRFKHVSVGRAVSIYMRHYEHLKSKSSVAVNIPEVVKADKDFAFNTRDLHGKVRDDFYNGYKNLLWCYVANAQFRSLVAEYRSLTGSRGARLAADGTSEDGGSGGYEDRHLAGESVLDDEPGPPVAGGAMILPMDDDASPEGRTAQLKLILSDMSLLYDLAWRAVHVSRIVANPADQEDAVQQAVVSVWQNRDTIWNSYDTANHSTPARHWVMRYMSNRFLDYRRKKTRINSKEKELTPKTLRNDDDDSLSVLEPESREAEPSQSAIARESALLLSGVHAKALPDDLYPYYELYFVQHLSNAEIAEKLDVPVGTVKSKLFRVREQLREAFFTAGHIDVRSAVERALIKIVQRLRDSKDAANRLEAVEADMLLFTLQGWSKDEVWHMVRRDHGTTAEEFETSRRTLARKLLNYRATTGVSPEMGLSEKDVQSFDILDTIKNIHTRNRRLRDEYNDSFIQKEKSGARLALRPRPVRTAFEKAEKLLDDPARDEWEDATEQHFLAKNYLAHFASAVLVDEFLGMSPVDPDYHLEVRILGAGTDPVVYRRLRQAYDTVRNPEKRRDIEKILRLIQFAGILISNPNDANRPQINRRTWPGRAELSEPMIWDAYRAFRALHPDETFVVGDVAVSDGSVTLDLIEYLQKQGAENFRVEVYDRYTHLYEFTRSAEDLRSGMTLWNPRLEKLAAERPELVRLHGLDVFDSKQVRALPRHQFMRITGLLMRKYPYFDETTILKAMASLGTAVAEGGKLLNATYWPKDGGGHEGAWDFYERSGPELRLISTEGMEPEITLVAAAWRTIPVSKGARLADGNGRRGSSDDIERMESVLEAVRNRPGMLPSLKVAARIYDANGRFLAAGDNRTGRPHAEPDAVLNAFDVRIQEFEKFKNVPSDKVELLKQTRNYLHMRWRTLDRDTDDITLALLDWMNIQLGYPLTGASFYISLDPCIQCARLLRRLGAAHVYYGMYDANPLQDGRGLAILDKGGIQVHNHLLQNSFAMENLAFVRWVKTVPRLYIALHDARKKIFAGWYRWKYSTRLKALETSLKAQSELRAILTAEPGSSVLSQNHLDWRPIRQRVSNPINMRMMMAIRSTVNPQLKPLKVIYGGAGTDVVGVLESLAPAEVKMVAHYQKMKREDLEKVKRMVEGSDGHRLPENDPRADDYRQVKTVYGFGTRHYLESIEDITKALAIELAAVNARNIRIEEESGGLKMIVDWDEPWSGKLRTVVLSFVDTDVTDPDNYPDFLKNWIRSGFDVYFQKAGLKIPTAYRQRPEFILNLFEHMREGGSFVTDDVAFLRFDPDLNADVFVNEDVNFPVESGLTTDYPVGLADIVQTKVSTSPMYLGSGLPLRQMYGFYMNIRRKEAGARLAVRVQSIERQLEDWKAKGGQVRPIRRVLIAEDQEEIAYLIRKIVTRIMKLDEDKAIDAVTNAEDAFARFTAAEQGSPYDMVITDFNMDTSKTGADLIDWVRRHEAQNHLRPAIMVLQSANLLDAQQALDAQITGIDTFFIDKLEIRAALLQINPAVNGARLADSQNARMLQAKLTEILKDHRRILEEFVNHPTSDTIDLYESVLYALKELEYFDINRALKQELKKNIIGIGRAILDARPDQFRPVDDKKLVYVYVRKSGSEPASSAGARLAVKTGIQIPKELLLPFLEGVKQTRPYGVGELAIQDDRGSIGRFRLDGTWFVFKEEGSGWVRMEELNSADRQAAGQKSHVPDLTEVLDRSLLAPDEAAELDLTMAYQLLRAAKGLGMEPANYLIDLRSLLSRVADEEVRRRIEQKVIELRAKISEEGLGRLVSVDKPDWESELLPDASTVLLWDKTQPGLLERVKKYDLQLVYEQGTNQFVPILSSVLFSNLLARILKVTNPDERDAMLREASPIFQKLTGGQTPLSQSYLEKMSVFDPSFTSQYQTIKPLSLRSYLEFAVYLQNLTRKFTAASA